MEKQPVELSAHDIILLQQAVTMAIADVVKQKAKLSEMVSSHDNIENVMNYYCLRHGKLIEINKTLLSKM